jgi:ankyrin repeat protein
MAASGILCAPVVSADANAASGSPDAALFESTMVGDVDGAASALAAGASPHYRNAHGITPLLVACGGVGPLAMVQLLLSAGAGVDSADPAGWTPLVYVASSGQLLLMEALLEAGAAVEGARGWTPLARAAYRGQVAAVARLLRAGADPAAAVEGRDCAALAEAGGHAEVVALLREHAAAQRRAGET